MKSKLKFLTYIFAGLALIWAWISSYHFFLSQQQSKYTLSPLPATNTSSQALPLTPADIISEPVDGWRTYTNDTFNFEFKIPANFTVANSFPSSRSILQLTFYEDGYWRGGMSFYDNSYEHVPPGVDLYKYLLSTSMDLQYQSYEQGDFANKLGESFSVDGLPTVHLLYHTHSAGTFDTFYFVKDERLFEIKIQGPENKYVSQGVEYLDPQNINLHSQDWYVTLLKSFKFK